MAMTLRGFRMTDLYSMLSCALTRDYRTPSGIQEKPEGTRTPKISTNIFQERSLHFCESAAGLWADIELGASDDIKRISKGYPNHQEQENISTDSCRVHFYGKVFLHVDKAWKQRPWKTRFRFGHLQQREQLYHWRLLSTGLKLLGRFGRKKKQSVCGRASKKKTCRL
ncbi:hypothetical protein E4T47_05005 [Aureobasidium subglaciale]|nr:hypothetical protein E4T47_05005 [Aureobasidium subglaciale]